MLIILGAGQAVDPFDYTDTHFNWVTDSEIGPKLAATINCLAQSSRKGGGAGKVIVIAHSMGGLATRYAASQTIGGRKVANELGLVVTLGTPNTDSPWATSFGGGWRWYCRLLVDGSNSNKESEVKKCERSSAIAGMMEGSQELRDLPKFPANVPVRAIAGQVQIFTQFFFGSISQQLSDDLVVPVQSATAEYTNTGRGDGKYVVRCSIRHYDSYGDPTKYQGGQCSHNEMYKIGYIQESVTNGIRDYLATIPKPLEKPQPDFNALGHDGGIVTMFNRLAIPHPQFWMGAMSEPDSFINFVDNGVCTASNAECPHIYFYNLADPNGCKYAGSDPVKTWEDWECPHAQMEDVEGPVDLKLGGVSAKFYRQRCGEQAKYAWDIPDKKIFIACSAGVDPNVAEAALERAKWL